MEENRFLNWTVKVSSKAEKYLKKLDKENQARFKKELIDLSKYNNPLEHPAVKPLTGDLKGFSRIRIGGYRIVFQILTEEKIIAVVNMAPRGNVY